MLFCPNCANLLVIGDETGRNKWACQTCPYEFPIHKQHTSRTRYTVKDAEALQDAFNDLDHMPTAQVDCEKCGHGVANYMQLQIRSADEPMTTFYRCAKCGHVRRED
ncbi:hypothetical protein BDV98DRAFT_160501 [Pterulicium gracile]|uniref:DNA-directed RNA polymerase subunit n=1 Tax=Pterulicium gracile TaxID=1884261 RepID=A0A5C3QZ96_9AGAR|nr:hypothetical protein BDV98DRAFT_160501 [Pterula gracilis]